MPTGKVKTNILVQARIPGEPLRMRYLKLKVSDPLYDLIADAADGEGLPMNELVVTVLAKHFKRADLAFVPRHKMGRPRKIVVGESRR